MTAGPVSSWQPSLLDVGEPSFDADFGGTVRHHLDDESWVDHVPGWMSGADRLFEEVLDGAGWGRRRRHMYDKVVDEPRLTAPWSEASGGWLHPVLDRARLALSERYGVRFDSVGHNLDRDGRDSVAWHADRIAREVEAPVVALLSLGAERRFLMRPKGGGSSTRFRVLGGDLLVTGGLAQRRWEHSVPKVAAAGPRISVAFRHGLYLGVNR